MENDVERRAARRFSMMLPVKVRFEPAMAFRSRARHATSAFAASISDRGQP